MEEWRYREMFEVEDRHWWFQSRRLIVRALLRAGGVTTPRRILDAGCGTGRNLLDYARLGHEAEGVDFSAEAVAFCRRRGLDAVRQAPLEELPYEDGRFDLVVATDVIEHLSDDHAALAELRRVTAPGGRIAVTVPAYQWLWSAHDESLHHFRRYTDARLRGAIVKAGWDPSTRHTSSRRCCPRSPWCAASPACAEAPRRAPRAWRWRRPPSRACSASPRGPRPG